MAASTASWTMLCGSAAIVLPPAPAWTSQYFPASTASLLRRPYPGLNEEECRATPPGCQCGCHANTTVSWRRAPTYRRLGRPRAPCSPQLWSLTRCPARPAVYLHPADKYSRLTRRPLQEQQVL